LPFNLISNLGALPTLLLPTPASSTHPNCDVPAVDGGVPCHLSHSSIKPSNRNRTTVACICYHIHCRWSRVPASSLAPSALPALLHTHSLTAALQMEESPHMGLRVTSGAMYPSRIKSSAVWRTSSPVRTPAGHLGSSFPHTLTTHAHTFKHNNCGASVPHCKVWTDLAHNTRSVQEGPSGPASHIVKVGGGFAARISYQGSLDVCVRWCVGVVLGWYLGMAAMLGCWDVGMLGC
jgi:hypothetical protein